MISEKRKRGMLQCRPHWIHGQRWLLDPSEKTYVRPPGEALRPPPVEPWRRQVQTDVLLEADGSRYCPNQQLMQNRAKSFEIIMVNRNTLNGQLWATWTPSWATWTPPWATWTPPWATWTPLWAAWRPLRACNQQLEGLMHNTWTTWRPLWACNEEPGELIKILWAVWSP